MRRTWLIGIAAIALAAGPAVAQGNGKGGGGGNAKGGGNDHAGHAMQAAQAANPGGGNSGGGGKQDHGSDGAKSERGQRDANGTAHATAMDDRGGGNGNRGQTQRAERMKADRGRGNDDRVQSVNGDRGRDDGVRSAVVDRRGGAARVRADDDGLRLRQVFDSSRGLIDGCPPGLAKKNPPCVPPGLARNDQRDWNNALARPDWWGLDRSVDGRYVYNDGYLYRVGSDGRIGSYVPLLGGALGIGNPWPSYYAPVEFPDYYRNYYGLGPSNAYRYADNVIYRVDPTTSAISSIAALLTGDTFNIGSPMPAGYDVYNVPYDYRDRYFDTPDANYRYSDGYIYQVDPTTQLIAAAIELLT